MEEITAVRVGNVVVETWHYIGVWCPVLCFDKRAKFLKLEDLRAFPLKSSFYVTI